MSSPQGLKVAVEGEFARLAAPRITVMLAYKELVHGAYFACLFTPWPMLSSDTWQIVAAAGLLLSAFAGVVEGPWAAVVFTLLYGSAVLSILRSS